MAQVRVERTIAASPERVFAWLLDPANLIVSPWFRKATWVNSSYPGVGATRELRGFGFWVHEQITAYDAPRSCLYRVVGGFPPVHQNGRLACTPSGDGTHVDWMSGYSIPARGGGKVLEASMPGLSKRAVAQGG